MTRLERELLLKPWAAARQDARVKLLAQDQELYVFAESRECIAEAKARADAADLEVQAWEQLMWSFQEPLPWAQPGEKWIAAEPIYDLGRQP